MIKNNKIFNSCLKAGGVLFCVFVAALFAVLGANVSYAQTAMVTSVTTNYPYDNDTLQNYQCQDLGNPSVAFLYETDDITNYANLGSSVDPWHNSALIEYDQPFYSSTTAITTPSNIYPNHCLQLCAEVTCVNPSRKVETSDTSSTNSLGIIQDVGSSDFPIQSVLFEIFKYQPNSNPYNADTTPPIRTIALTPVDNNICHGVGTYSTGTGNNERLVSCCELFTGQGRCVRQACEGSTNPSGNCPSPCLKHTSSGCYLRDNAYAEAFCSKFGAKLNCEYGTEGPNHDITTWQAGQSCKWENGRCVPKCTEISSQSSCGFRHLRHSGGKKLGSPYEDDPLGYQVCEWRTETTCTTPSNDACRSLSSTADCAGNTACMWTEAATGASMSSCYDTVRNFHTYADCKAGITKIPFCVAWDGSYEIDGEFGKSNGQFGFRANVKTKWPGDGISSGGDVEVDHTMAYPGENQIPIQIDVTNVHSVRSSSTMVGTTTKVPVQPYDLTYKLSKDALTTIVLSDPGTRCQCGMKETVDGSTLPVGTFYNDYQCQNATSVTDEADLIDFNIIEDQPRLGEGIPDGVNTNLDSWDGRDNYGNFLPYGNYLVTVSAKTHDEWSGTDKEDLSRAVTRQLSLDPLKITDIKETGLAKLSTSYAKIDYVITENAEVHVVVFTPGTHFDSTIDMPGVVDPYVYLNTAGNVAGGNMVAHIVEQKQGRVNVNTKWDGICRNPQGCDFNNETYNEGTPMPDGDYVYVMWAEIPYTRNPQQYFNDHLICVNGKWWAGVRTRKYHNGILPINRGLPEITVGAVGYTSLGSSPTAFGLDPFTFNYAVSRDSIVDATIKTTANAGATPTLVKKLLTNEVAISSKENKFTWDGIDEAGYQVAPGTYMVEFVAKDSLYPEKQATMTVQFPVDLFRVVDVNTTPILDQATSQATISYTLSKSMDVTVEIYDQNTTIPTDDTNWCDYSSGTLAPVPGGTLLKSFVLPRAGEGMTITEVWDGLDHSVPGTSAVAPLPDGNYPYRICTRTTQNVAQYYDYTTATPVALPTANTSERIGASDKPTGFVTIARGSIAFNKILITPSQPTMKYSSETIYLPAYEVAFSTSRPASVNIEVISTQNGQCEGGAPAGTTCRTLSTYIYNGTDGYFDPTKLYKVYWDGKDSKGEYVKYGSYEIKLIGLPYPMPAAVLGNLPAETIYSEVISVNNFQVYDRYVEDITRDNPTGKFAYQISVPMKVAIQIFKPGTMTNRNSTTSTGLIDPVTQADVANANINDVLVKSIVGIRPNLVSLDEVWDGTDYAGQEVPDGIYPYRYVTVLNAYDMDSVTGALNLTTDTLATAGDMIADWEKYITLEHINVARGDSWYADVDWKSKKVTSFFPNPLRGSEGWFEIAKLPAPGRISIKIYNIAGDLVRDGNSFTCMNAQGETDTLGNINSDPIGLQPYMNLPGAATTSPSRNFTLRCKWDKTNDHGRQVARGLYYAIMELDPTRGNSKKSQRVIKILIP